MYRYVLFDLDGTLTDPKEGICKSVQYALHAQGIEEPDIDKLEPFIGPPLADSFRAFYGMDEERVQTAVAKFRERYTAIGIYENEIYPGMKDFLAGLQKRGVRLAVASSKPKEMVEKVLTHFQIRGYFEVIAGSEMDGRKVKKTEVMREALAKLFSVPEDEVAAKLPVSEILMVGDRKFDVLGAKEFSVASAAVSYGYAPEGELAEAGADYITDNLEELWQIIVKGKTEGIRGAAYDAVGSFGKKRDKVGALHKSFRILLPVVYDYTLTNVIALLAVRGLYALASRMPQGSALTRLETLLSSSQILAALLQAAASLIGVWIFYCLYRKERPKPISHVIQRRHEKRLQKQAGLLAGLAICLALFLNIVISIAISSLDVLYQKTVSVQYSIPMAAGLVIYGIITPIEEELVFRGLVYGRMRRYFSTRISIPISALLFGAYHGNLVQLIYAFFMGLLLAWAMEEYQSIKAPVLIHGAANLVVYAASGMAPVWEALCSAPGCVITGILALGFLACLKYQNKRLARNHMGLLQNKKQ